MTDECQNIYVHYAIQMIHPSHTIGGPGVLAKVDVVPHRQQISIFPYVPHRGSREKVEVTLTKVEFGDNSQITMNWTPKLITIDLVDAVTQARWISPE